MSEDSKTILNNKPDEQITGSFEKLIKRAFALSVAICIISAIALYFISNVKVNRFNEQIKRITICNDVLELEYKDYVDVQISEIKERQNIILWVVSIVSIFASVLTYFIKEELVLRTEKSVKKQVEVDVKKELESSEVKNRIKSIIEKKVEDKLIETNNKINDSISTTNTIFEIQTNKIDALALKQLAYITYPNDYNPNSFNRNQFDDFLSFLHQSFSKVEDLWLRAEYVEGIMISNGNLDDAKKQIAIIYKSLDTAETEHKPSITTDKEDKQVIKLYTDILSLFLGLLSGNNDRYDTIINELKKYKDQDPSKIKIGTFDDLNSWWKIKQQEEIKYKTQITTLINLLPKENVDESTTQ